MGDFNRFLCVGVCVEGDWNVNFNMFPWILLWQWEKLNVLNIF